VKLDHQPTLPNVIFKQSQNVASDNMMLTLVPEVYFSSPLPRENNKNKHLEPGYMMLDYTVSTGIFKHACISYEKI
jgi:hypothetical protein